MIEQPLEPVVRATSYVSGEGLAAVAAFDPAAFYDLDRAERSPVRASSRWRPRAASWPMHCSIDVSRAIAGTDRSRATSGTLLHAVSARLGDPDDPMDDAGLAEKTRRMLAGLGRGDIVEPLLTVTARAFDGDAEAAALARLFVSGHLVG